MSSLAFSSDGATLASSSVDGVARIWDVATGRPVGEASTGFVTSAFGAAVSPDGKTFASGGIDGKVRLWDVAGGRPLGEPIDAHTTPIWSVAFSPNGAIVASGGTDNTVKLWDVAAGHALGEPLAGHTAMILSLAFSPDGATLASGSSDNTVRLWDVATGRPLGRPLTGHAGAIWGVAFSPDGKVVASGSHDRSIILRNVGTGQPIGRPLRGQASVVYSVAFSPDGETLAAGGPDGVVLWDLGPDSWQAVGCARAGRNLTEIEWLQYLEGEPYRVTCPSVSAEVAIASPAEQGERAPATAEAAAAKIEEAVRLVVQSGSPEDNNAMCWKGSIGGRAHVVLPACERAVELAPDNGSYRDSRGLARALTGDRHSAVEDFRFFVEWARQHGLYERYGPKREAWIAALEAGRDPFDAATLEALRDE